MVRALVQRVTSASVTVEGRTVGAIKRGLAVLLAIRHDDNETRAGMLAERVVRLRIFADESGRMNKSLLDIGGELLIVPQFTLYGDTAKGHRPSFAEAAEPSLANALYDYFVRRCQLHPITVQTGQFRTHMQVHLVNDGPVTLMCEVE